MTNNHEDRSDNNKSPADGRRSGDRQERREPLFSGFDEDDEEGFEEPDRDTDYSSGYGVDSVEEEDDFDEALPDEDEDDARLSSSARAPQETDSRWEEPEADAADDDTQDWTEEEDYADEDEDSSQGWPMGLIAVAIVALMLLAFGGYGVIQQRTETQEELRELRAALATAANPEELMANRTALQDLQAANTELSAKVETLTLENRQLIYTVAGLEAQLEPQQAALAGKTTAAGKPAASTAPANTAKPEAAAPQSAKAKPAAPKPAAAKPASATPSAAATSGPWFVNFGSYAASAMAETWATRLNPTAGKVIIAPSESNGRTLYRVRVVGLPNKEVASKVARKLEAELGVSKLWVGSE